MMRPLVLLLFCLGCWSPTQAAFIAPILHKFGVPRCTTSRNSDAVTVVLQVASRDHFDMEELRQRIQQEDAYSPRILNGLIPPSSPSPSQTLPEVVHVILFQPGMPEQSAHTIESPQGSGNNVILAFTSLKACIKFANALKEQDFFDPTPQELQLKELTTICDRLGVVVQVVPEGVELIPPSQNVKKFGHNPELLESKKYLDYLFDMNDDDDDDFIGDEELGVLE